ncbi:MAG: tetratricopeptide repeat protein [Candidatus Eisenbacteria sp.]|nr:tetratricopeptide repeat protein [Candidatus Eisenbacteria bacterium]
MRCVGWVVFAVVAVCLVWPRSALARDLEDFLGEAEGLYWETRYYEALEVGEDAVEWFGQSPEAHSMMGRILFKIARFEEARERFEKAIELDPYDFWGHYGLGLYFLAAGNPEEAGEQFTAARTTWPESDLPCLMLARAAEELDRYDEAYGWMDAAIGAIEHQGRSAPRSLELERHRLDYLSDREPCRVSAAFVKATVPMVDGRPVIRVRLGPDAEGLFLLDTTAAQGVTVHPAAVFRTLGEHIADLDDLGPGVRAASYLYLLDRLEIGELTVRDVPCLVTERVVLAGVDGVLGLPFLRRFSWTFDFSGGEITVRDPAMDPGRAFRFGPDLVESGIYPGGPLMIPLLLDRQWPAVFVLDSASDAVSLDHEFFERELEGFIPPGQRRDLQPGDNPHGAIPMVAFELASIRVDDEMILEDVTVRTYAVEDVRRRAGVAAPGVLGMGALADWVIDLDFQAGTATLRKSR